MSQDELKSECDSIGKILSRLNGEYGERAIDFIPLIKLASQLKGAKSFFKDALGFYDIRDFVAELRFVLYFHNADCIVEFVPRSKETTPDLFVTNSEFRGFVEVKHIHKKHNGPRGLQSKDSVPLEKFEEYGIYARDEKYCRGEIIGGFKQLRNFSGLKKTDWMIVAVWNTDEDLDEIDMESSLNQLIKEESEFENMPNPKCIVYSSDWYSIRKQTQFHVFRF